MKFNLDGSHGDGVKDAAPIGWVSRQGKFFPLLWCYQCQSHHVEGEHSQAQKLRAVPPPETP